jgi:hypothetical protein
MEIFGNGVFHIFLYIFAMAWAKTLINACVKAGDIPRAEKCGA